VFRPGPEGTELLFIERARHPHDPWSGHMAFPGGRVDGGDRDSAATARRETLEELGLDLSGAEELGRLDDLDAANRRITVSAHAYWMHDARDRTLSPDPSEVADALWLGVRALAHPERVVDYHYPKLPGQTFPGLTVDRSRVIWGMTLRFLEDLYKRLDLPLQLRR